MVQICGDVAYLDEEVREQGSKESSNSNVDVLSKDDALRLDHEEVDELLDIVEETLKRSLGDGEVLARPELGSETLSNRKLSSNLCGGSGTKYNPGELEDVADDVQVTGGEYEEDGGSEGDTGGAGVLPAQKAVEQAVVVCVVLGMPPKVVPAALLTGEVLASSGLLVRNLLGVGKIGELIASLCALCFGLLSNGSYKISLESLVGDLGICVARPR